MRTRETASLSTRNCSSDGVSSNDDKSSQLSAFGRASIVSVRRLTLEEKKGGVFVAVSELRQSTSRAFGDTHPFVSSAPHGQIVARHECELERSRSRNGLKYPVHTTAHDVGGSVAPNQASHTRLSSPFAIHVAHVWTVIVPAAGPDTDSQSIARAAATTSPRPATACFCG